MNDASPALHIGGRLRKPPRAPRRLALRPFVLTMLACVGWYALIPSSSTAVPRYAAQYRQDCNLCHHNPTGGGLRSLYASQYLVPAEMALLRMREEQLEKIQPQVSESITLGTDVRVVHHVADRDRPAPELNFFQMQADLYVRFQADERFSAYLDRGQSSTLELFGLAYVLPWNGFVKFGRFTPDFGWKLADHRQFTREGRAGDGLPRDLFFDPPAHTDVGIEIGLSPGPWTLTASLINGSMSGAAAGAPGASGLPFDDNTNLGHVTRAAYRFTVGPVGFSVGGSWWRNKGSALRNAGGPFGYVNVGPLTWVGEADWSVLDPDPTRASFNPNAFSRTAFFTSHEVTWRIYRGVDLRGTFNFADPDVDLKTGTRFKSGGGIDALLTPFFGIKAMVNVYRDEEGADVKALTYMQSEVTLHALY